MRYKLTVILSAALLLGSCCTGRKAALAETRLERDSVGTVRSLVDTLMVKDSVSVTLETRHDTVYRTEYRERVRWKVREMRDTLTVWRKDSVATLATAERERGRGVWEEAKTASAGCVAGMVLAALLYVIWRWRAGTWK